MVTGTHRETDSGDSDRDGSDVAVERGGVLSRATRRRIVENDPDPSPDEEADDIVTVVNCTRPEPAQLADQNDTSGYGTLSPQDHSDQATDQLPEGGVGHLSSSELYPPISEGTEHHSRSSGSTPRDEESFRNRSEASFSQPISISNMGRSSITPCDSVQDNSPTQLACDQDAGVIVTSGNSNASSDYEHRQETVPGWKQPQEMATLSHALVWGPEFVHPCTDISYLDYQMDVPTLKEQGTMRPFLYNVP